MTVRRRPSIKRLVRSAFLLSSTLVFSTCELVNQPGEAGGPIVVRYTGGTTLVVNRRFAPTVQVTQNNVPVIAPRLQFITSDPATVLVSNDTLIPMKRGTARVTVRLVGSTFGANPPDTTVDVQVIAAAVRADLTTLTMRNLNDTITLRARAVGDADTAIAAPEIRWESSSPSVATIDSISGRLRSLSNGTTLAIAQVDGRKDSVSVTVTQLLAEFTFASQQIAFASLGDATTIVATPRDSLGTVIPPAQAPAVTWTSSLSSNASVSNTGLVTALANGPTFIIASAGAVADTVSVEVRQIARQVVITGPDSIGIEAIFDEADLNAIAFDARGGTVLTFTPTWQSLDLDTATVNPSSGVVRAEAVGRARIVASLDFGADTVRVFVTNFARELDITPDTVRITAVGDAAALIATPRNRLGAPLPTLPVTWSAPDPTIATVNASGVTTAQAIGTGRVVATAQAGALTLADTAFILIVNSPDSVNILDVAITLASVQDVITPNVTIKNSRGALLGLNSVAWTSDDPGIASVSPVGLIRALAEGTTRIRATNPLNAGRTDSVTVTVTNAPASLVLNRVLDTLTAPSKTLSYVAVVRNARGDVITPTVAWTSTNNAAATVSQTGLATAVAIGLDSVIASVTGAAGPRADTAVLVVRNLPVTLTVSPTSIAFVSVGATQQLTATARNDLGNVIGGLTFDWSAAGAAGVNGSGLVTAAAVGSTTVTVSTQASAGAIVSTGVPVTVTNAPTSINITDADFTLASLGDTRTLGFLFSNATTPSLPASAVNWTTTDASVATVSGTGVVTAVGAGTATIRASSPADGAIFDQVVATVTNAPATLTIAPGATTLTSIGATVTFTATVRNAAGNVITAPSPAVTWSDGGSAAVSVGASSGVVTADANGSATITATAGAATNNVGVTVGQVASAATSTISAGAGSLTANGAANTTITVQLKDALGVNLTTGPVVVTMSLFGTGALGGVTNVGNGTYTATLTAPTSLGAGTVSASVGASSITTGNPTMSYVAGTATKYLVSSSSAAPVAGTAVTITAQLADAQNNPVAAAGKTITWTSSGGGSFPGTSVTNGSGVATISFTTNTVAATVHTVTATDDTPGTPLTGTSGTITTLGGAAHNYVVIPATTSPVAGASITISAQLRDNNNNPLAISGVSVDWTKSNANGSFTPGNATTGTTLTNSSGVATITLNTHTVSATGTTVTATSTGGVSGVSLAIATVPGAASGATTTIAAGSPVTAGSPSAITVTARDGNSNLLTASGGTVTLATTLGSLGAVTDNGNGSYSATLTTSASGTATISGTIAGAPVTSGNPNVVITVGAASAATTAITAAPTSVTADGAATSTITVQARDAQGNNRTVETDVVTITASPGGALAVSAGPAGSGTYTATLPGSITAGLVTVTGTINAVAVADDATVTRTAGTATNYLVTPASTGVAAGAIVLVTAQLRDGNNNPVAISGKTVSWSKTGTGGSFATPTSLTDATGQALVAFTVHTVPGTLHTVTATDNTALTGTSATVTVTTGAPSQLVFVVQPPATVEANQTLAPAVQVEVRDQFGNPVTTDPGGPTEQVTIAFTAGTNTEGATLGGTLTRDVVWASGRAVFDDLSVNLSGSYSLTATDVNFTPSLSDATSSAFGVLTTTATISASTGTTEAALNSGTLTVDLTAGTYGPALGLDGADFTLNGTPAGVTIAAAVTRISATSATIALNFDGTDFDVTQNISVNVLASALATGTPATTGTTAFAPTAATVVVLTGPASVEAGAVSSVITLTTREANTTTMTVATDEVLGLSQTAGTGTAIFYSDAGGTNVITSATITNGTATTTFYYRNATTGAKTITAADGTDEGVSFADVTHDITVPTTTAAVTTNPASLTEENLDGSTFTVTLTSGTYDGTLAVSDFSLTGAPAGTSIQAVNRVSDVVAELTIDYNLTDFDVSHTPAVNVLAAALATGVPATTNTVTVTPDAASFVTIVFPAAFDAGTVSGAFTLTAREANGTSMTVATDEVFALSSSSPGIHQFANNADGSGVTTTTTIANGTSTAVFYYTDDTPGMWTIEASDGVDEGADLGDASDDIVVLVP